MVEPQKSGLERKKTTHQVLYTAVDGDATRAPAWQLPRRPAVRRAQRKESLKGPESGARRNSQLLRSLSA